VSKICPRLSGLRTATMLINPYTQIATLMYTVTPTLIDCVEDECKLWDVNSECCTELLEYDILNHRHLNHYHMYKHECKEHHYKYEYNGEQPPFIKICGQDNGPIDYTPNLPTYPEQVRYL